VKENEKYQAEIRAGLQSAEPLVHNPRFLFSLFQVEVFAKCQILLWL
jgi:hypothetical protein